MNPGEHSNVDPRADRDLLVERVDAVAVFTFNREERLNALGERLIGQLSAAWAEVKADPAVRAVVVTGVGERAFCVGMDLKETVGRGGFRETPTNVREAVKLTALQNDVWLPTIVAVNGVCAGGGLHFVADADVVIASERATFVDTHVNVGQVTALEPTGLLYRVGVGRALRMAVLGSADRIPAEEARRIGLVDEVVAPEALRNRALELAEWATRGSPTAIAESKRAIWDALEMPMSLALQAGHDRVLGHREHPDAAEGPAAFAAKRTPRWEAG